MQKILLLLCSLLLALASQGSAQPLKPYRTCKTQVPEPSDICVSVKGTSFWIVSDKGYLYETDTLGKIIHKADFEGVDFEGVCTRKGEKGEDLVVVMSESLRQLHYFDANTLKHLYFEQFAHYGGRNEGFECIAFLGNEPIAFTEKNPCELKFLKSNKTVAIKGIKEVSACFVDEKTQNLWVLSDEQMEIFELNTNDFSIVQKHKIAVLNPEGLCMMNDGHLVVVSDDLQKLFFYAPIKP